MSDSSIYSIGHGNKDIKQFLSELQAFQINYLLDVRSKPYSRWNPQFNKKFIEKTLNKHGISYAFFGHLLGGIPEDPSCYDDKGAVVYSKIKEKEFFRKGMQRLLNANIKGIRIALMCSESNPQHCHRTKLIGTELLTRENISVGHIISINNYKSQETVMREITGNQGTIDFFGDE